jgi:hypothetical protein
MGAIPRKAERGEVSRLPLFRLAAFALAVASLVILRRMSDLFLQGTMSICVVTFIAVFVSLAFHDHPPETERE